MSKILSNIIITLIVLAIIKISGAQTIKFVDPFVKLNFETQQNIEKNAEVSELIVYPGETVDFQIVLQVMKGKVSIITEKTETDFVQPSFYLQLNFRTTKKRSDDRPVYPDILFPLPSISRNEFLIDIQNQQVKSRVNLSYLALWVDLKIAEKAVEGKFPVNFIFKIDNLEEMRKTILLNVQKSLKLKEVDFAIDYNEYGDKYIDSKTKNKGLKLLREMENKYYKFIDQHKGTLNVLPYKSQSGKSREGMTPELEGEGKEKHIKNWHLFEERYSGYLNGNVFESSKPIRHFYLPFNPNWPASFDLYFTDRKKYEDEWQAVAEDFIRYFKEKNWNQTIFQVYMNQKPNDKNKIPWNLDEPKGLEDYLGLQYYSDLFERAFQNAAPLQIQFRMDISHFYCDEHIGSIRKDFRVNKGKEKLKKVDIWTISNHSLKSETAIQKAQQLKKAGKEVWHYGITPQLEDSPLKIYELVFNDWFYGFTGIMLWKTLNRKLDSGSGKDFIFYKGNKFGLNEPLASIRMKHLRDAKTDLKFLQELDVDSQKDLEKILNSGSRYEMRKNLIERLHGGN